MHMAPAPSYPQTHTTPSGSTGSFHRSNPAAPINTSRPELMSPNDSNTRTVRAEPETQHSTAASDDGSIHEEEYTTALPAFSAAQAPKELKEKDRRERGLRGVLPFQRKKKDKERDKDRDNHKDKDKEREKGKHKDKDGHRDKERGILDLVERERRADFSMGSMRGRPDKEKRREDRDDEF